MITAAVFNAGQIDGIPALEPERTRVDWDPVEQVERLLGGLGGKNRASPTEGPPYNFARDTIRLPLPRNVLRHPALIMRRRLHELGHWTAHPDRPRP